MNNFRYYDRSYQLFLAYNVLNAANDYAGLDTLFDAIKKGPGRVDAFLTDAGYVGEEVAKLLAKRGGGDPAIAIAHEQSRQLYDFRPSARKYGPSKASPPDGNAT